MTPNRRANTLSHARSRAPSSTVPAAAIFATVVAFTLLAAGCGDKKKGAPADTSSFKYFAADTDILVGVNGALARKGDTAQMLSAMPDAIAKLVKSLKSCGIDVIGSVDTVVVGSSSVTQKGVAVVKGFGKSNFKQCGELAQEFGIAQDAKSTTLTIRNQRVHLAWIDETTFVGGPFWTKPELTAMADGKAGAGADSNKKLMNLLGEVDTTSAIWFVFAPANIDVLPEIPGGGKVSAAFGAISLSDGLALRVGVDLGSSKSADGAVKMIKSAIPMFKNDIGPLGKYLGRLKFRSSGSKVILEVKLSKQELIDVTKAIASNPMIRSLTE